MNNFPADFNSPLTGFGGDSSKDQATHRREIKKTPIILVHGNGANASHPKWGWQTMVEFLKGIKYNKVEIWAMDYLGEHFGEDLKDMPPLIGAHRNHINKFREFVDGVITYLGVKKVDFIAHSLGCGMVNAYIKGLQSDGTWKQQDNRIDVVGTFVALAGGTDGLGFKAIDEFKSGSDFERQSHVFNGIDDDTPCGLTDVTKQISPEPSWKKTTSLDSNSASCVAVIAVGDLADMQYRDTSHRDGADLNKRYILEGDFMRRHELVIKSKTIFNDFKDYMNKYSPQPRVAVSVDKVSGNYSAPLQITITVNPTDQHVDYVARRLRKEFQAGYIVESVDEKLSGTIINNESLTLPSSGAWELTLSAAGADDVAAAYGVDVELPVVIIETDNTTPFERSLDVKAKATRGKLYHSPDGHGWIEGCIFHLTRTCTVHFVALDEQGIASAIVEKGYNKKIPWDDCVTATLSEHFIAKRIDLRQFLDLGNTLGFNATVTLYRIEGKWVPTPEPEERIEERLKDLEAENAKLRLEIANMRLSSDSRSRT